jgi:2-oxoacid dehydrogenases acyltransferase (catalytic domain)
MNVPSRSRDRGEVYTIEPLALTLEGRSASIGSEPRPGLTVVFLGEVDLSQVERVREQAILYQKPSYTTFVVKAVALAVRDHPHANRRVCRGGAWPFGGLRTQSFLHRDLAVAMDREVPGSEATPSVDVLEDADEALLEKINADLRALTKDGVSPHGLASQFGGLMARLPAWVTRRWFRGKLESPEFWARHRGGAILVSSPPKDGIDTILETGPYPIVVTFGLVKDRPVVVEGEVVVRKTFNLSLQFDRRVMTASLAARFFHRIVEILEKAEVEMKPYLLDEVPMTREDFPTVDEARTQF